MADDDFAIEVVSMSGTETARIGVALTSAFVLQMNSLAAQHGRGPVLDALLSGYINLAIGWIGKERLLRVLQKIIDDKQLDLFELVQRDEGGDG